MNCIEARSRITPFIKKELGEKEQEEFLKHVEHCADCRDELEIYFTVHWALDAPDDSSGYDFQNMLEEEIKTAKRGIIRKRTAQAARSFVLIVVEILILLSVWIGYELHGNLGRDGMLHRTFYGIKSGMLCEEHTDAPEYQAHCLEQAEMKL